jgi:hypothetical protein
MYADVVLYSSGNQQAWQLPKSAVVTTTERKYVLVMNGGIIRKVDITTGYEGLDKVEAFGRLQAGDSVIVNASEEINELR